MTLQGHLSLRSCQVCASVCWRRPRADAPPPPPPPASVCRPSARVQQLHAGVSSSDNAPVSAGSMHVLMHTPALQRGGTRSWPHKPSNKPCCSQSDSQHSIRGCSPCFSGGGGHRWMDTFIAKRCSPQHAVAGGSVHTDRQRPKHPLCMGCNTLRDIVIACCWQMMRASQCLVAAKAPGDTTPLSCQTEAQHADSL
jgi:hypothetical protein